MGYRPRYRPDRLSIYNTENEIRELQQERANYVFLLNEMSPWPGDPVDQSFQDAIADVDARIEKLKPPPPPRINPIVQSKPLPPPNPNLVTKGHM